MAVSATLRFVQGPNSDTAGRAVKGTLTDGVCTVSNGVDVGVSTWKYEMLYVPPGSAVPLTVQGPNATSTFTFTPDVAGTYRVRLTVVGSSVSDSNVDIRCFCVAFPNGIIAPPYQRYPAQLPLTGAGGKSDEMNIGGQPFGWDGDGDVSRKLLYQALKQLDAAVGGGPYLPLSGAIPMLGNFNAGGFDIVNGRGLYVNYTAIDTQYPIRFTNTAIRTNGAPSFGKGVFFVENIGLNNNQPTMRLTYNVETTSFGNVGFIIENLGGSTLADVVHSSSVELLAHNPNGGNDHNGKGEFGQASGQTTGIAEFMDGYFYFAYRRGAEHPSGANSGFNRHVNLLPNTIVGKGKLQLRGYGLEIDPEWDFGTNSYISNRNPFNSATLTNGSDSADLAHYARTENYGPGTSYIRNRCAGVGSSSYVYSQSDAGPAYVEIRANWVTPGTTDAELHLYVDSTGSGWVVEAKGSGEDLNIIHRVGAVATTTVNFDGASEGMASFYRWSNSQLGRISLGDRSGAAGGGIFSYSSITGIYAMSGAYSFITFDNSGVVEPNRLEQFAPLTGSTIAPHASTTQVILTTGSLAALTINLPSGVNNTHQIVFRSTGDITAITWNPLGGASVAAGAPTSFGAGAMVTAIYRESVNIWYISGTAATLPSSMSGKAGQVPVVNGGETVLTYSTIPSTFVVHVLAATYGAPITAGQTITAPRWAPATVRVRVLTAPTVSTLTVTVNVNGSSIGSVALGVGVLTNSAALTTTIRNAGDIITVDTSGADVGWANLVVEVNGNMYLA